MQGWKYKDLYGNNGFSQNSKKNLRLKKKKLTLLACSGTVSGLIKNDLGGFWFLFLPLYIFFHKIGHRDEAAERNHRRKRVINLLPNLRYPFVFFIRAACTVRRNTLQTFASRAIERGFIHIPYYPNRWKIA